MEEQVLRREPGACAEEEEGGGGGFATDAQDVSENLADAPPLRPGGTDSKREKCNAPPGSLPKSREEEEEIGNRQN